MDGTSHTSFRSEAARAARTAGLLTATLLASAAAMLAIPGMPVPGALAGDLDYAAEESGSRFIRLGLDKSAVIKLPAEVRDVLVGNPDVVDAVVRTRTTAYLFARKVGQTNIFFFDAQGQQILSIDIEVSQDMAALQKLIRRTLPGTKVTVDTIGDNVVLGGIAATPAEAATAMDLAVKFADNKPERVMSTINVTGKEQVMLRVRIAEVERKTVKQLGFNLQAAFSAGDLALRLASINPFTANAAGLISPNGGYAGSYQNGSTQIDGVLRAMEDVGLIRTLAEPTLTAISGESAKFLAGGEFPVAAGKSSENGITTTKIEYKPFGVSLGFTPVVMSEGRIVLKINTEVSELGEVTSFDGFTLPELKVRRVETTVELPSGGSLAMAGLIKESTKQSMAGLPGAKNLPVLGALFRSRDYLKNETELVVIVTPYLVNSVNEKQLAMPTDRLGIPSEKQSLFMGQLNKVYAPKGLNPKGVYHGNIGFIVE